ncbi:MAG: ATP-binding protein [Dehalococcoidia bacterium]
MRTAAPAAQEWPWRRGPGAVLESLKSRLLDARFWAVQGMVAAITVVHYTVESFPVEDSISTVHHIPVILYLIPVVYASLYYGWEGGVLTALWASVLSLPSIVLSHLADFHWVGEVGQLGVTLAVGAVLAWRVRLEAEQRQRAESSSRELAVSEEKYRSIFESAGDPILVCDSEGRIVASNDALAAMCGFSSPPAGVQTSELFGEEGARRFLSTAFAPANPLRLTLVRGDGSTIIVDAVRTFLGGDSEEATVQAIIRDVTEQERRHEQMRAYVRAVTKAQEEERTRIARELHDDTAQALVMLGRGLDAAQDSTDGANLEEAKALADSILEGVRRFSRDLRPSILDDLGLLPAIEWVSAEATQRGQIRAAVEVRGEPRRLSAEAELVLFRIAQEALRNAEKHAGDCAATVSVEFAEDEVVLSVSDDGRGFDAATSDDAGRGGKLGLLGMKERADLLGAHFEIQSEPGKGTTVAVVMSTTDPVSLT